MRCIAPRPAKFALVSWSHARLLSWRTIINGSFVSPANLDKLRYAEKCGKSLSSLYERHIGKLLAGITSDALTWTQLSPDKCLLECAMLHSGKIVS